MADSTAAYSVPAETQRIFSEQILSNPLVPPIDPETKALAKLVHFVGAAAPSIPINWRFAESISALKGYEATLLNGLVAKKYGVAPSEVTIDVSHASLFVMSLLMAQVIDEVDGKPKPLDLVGSGIEKWFPNTDKHRFSSSLHRTLASNIYRTSDGRFYHVHGSMNPDPTLEALGLGLDGEEADDHTSVVARIQEAVGKHEATELDKLMNEKYRQAGTICFTTEEYLSNDFGKETSKVGLYEISKHPDSAQSASWWPENASMPSSPQRPLAGLKIVDLTRVIAGPSISRGLAEMGASVMKVASPHVTDIHALHQDLNWGKWSTHLHLKDEEDRKKLEALIMEADVVVDGYRPGVMEKHGFGRERIFELVKGRDRGIIHVRENCYGWKAPEWVVGRSGWQQISDACCGVSMEYGRAMGNDEPVTPVFPNSDYCTGVIGSTAVLHALMQRASLGGSYALDVSLNYYSQWLVQSVGTYPDAVWTELWQRHESPVFRHYHNMTHTVFTVLKLLTAHDKDVMFRPEFFETRPAKAVGATFVSVKPILNFVGPNAPVLRYNVGTRGNGVDEPVWPEDLGVEIVKSK